MSMIITSRRTVEGFSMFATTTPLQTPLATNRRRRRRDALIVLVWLAIVAGGGLAGGTVQTPHRRLHWQLRRHRRGRLPGDVAQSRVGAPCRAAPTGLTGIRIRH